MSAAKPENHEITVESTVMIAVRDGVKLATDIYRPARNGKALEGKFPVILERTPYGKTRASRSEVDRGETQPRLRPRGMGEGCHPDCGLSAVM
ncbi:MAG TPA: CocE/NonD family hydrolase [Burkholderiales bacterium]|nr:CocE/NonD family hydrolase [Burkholderiales bacterium]